MLKNWKHLFVKSTDATEAGKEEPTSSYSFPVQESYVPAPKDAGIPVSTITHSAAVNEVIGVYESGLESINMPGYDFYEFYMAISSTGSSSEQTYQLAFQMAKSMDKSISVQKLLGDAEFYISKINEVHGQYVSQGKAKLQSIEGEKQQQKGQLEHAIQEGNNRLAMLRAELQQLEADVNNKKGQLHKIDEGFAPQELSIREKLQANDAARTASIDKLNRIKEGIARYVKQ